MGKRLRDSVLKLPSENFFQAILKAHIFSKSSPAGKVRLDPASYKDVCSKCYTPWQDGLFSVAFMHPTARDVKQLQKYRERNLSSKQDRLKRYLAVKMYPAAKYTCEVCSFKTRVVLKTSVIPKRSETNNGVAAEKKERGPSKKEEKFAPKDFRVAQQMLESKLVNGNSVQEKGKCNKENRKRKHN